MSGPKMQNAYPAAISTYPSWVAHETPYTAEWGNSVGYEFYLIEYELGEAPRGSYNSVKERLDAMPQFVGFSYFARGYYTYPLGSTTSGEKPLYFNVADRDIDGSFDLVGRRNITAKVAGWYRITWNQLIEVVSSTFPCDVWLDVTRSRGGVPSHVGECRIVFEATNLLTLLVNTIVYLNEGEYIYGSVWIGENNIVNRRTDYGTGLILFELLTAEPYG